MATSRILVVEDELIVAIDIENKLKRLGHEISALVSTGEEAVQKAEESRPDLVLMDIRLKGKIDGIEAADQIRERFNIPVVYLTAYADDTTLQRAKVTEPLGYVLKPFREDELKSVLEMALYRRQVDGHRRTEGGASAAHLYTTTEVAETLNLSESAVRALANTRKVGARFGRDWVFTDADIDRMRQRNPRGRPRKYG